jgi:hypothetical protein
MRTVGDGDVVETVDVAHDPLTSLRDEERAAVRERDRNDDESGDDDNEGEREPAHGFLLRVTSLIRRGPSRRSSRVSVRP